MLFPSTEDVKTSIKSSYLFADDVRGTISPLWKKYTFVPNNCEGSDYVIGQY